jgi:hypothetical protein
LSGVISTICGLSPLALPREHRGLMPTVFHGDHAAAFVAGACLRGLTNYDVPEAYRLLLRNVKVGP